ncbi:4-hydroxy-tetrahydrodipicolinate synthase [Methanomassiliicoccus luminyensis]|jgi:4-hydroxy-tetrahydrodipicolinate synthase|uniref:4-hydroxy-tetrahydrodipicolinate synthase n=1 Tax=Methanomassiliicoccus luminyensis TaxID=1080712 RepID=UPI00037B0596|nr:4-hydroxy-tetrahydrodipicolinate synthase [Methanomassiliicoccus luminyensis]
MFSGCATAIITPMRRDGAIDEDGLRELVRFQEDNGISMLVPCGTTGESATLDYQEHLRVIEIVVDEAKRARVVAGTGANATSEAVHLSKAAQDLGAHALLSVSPYYNKPTPAGVVKHFEAIAGAVDIPIIVYNIPSRTGSNINAATMLKMAEIPGIAGVKEASGDLAQMAAIAASAPKDFTVLSGDDALTVPAMAVGAKGVISVVSNIVPDRVVSLVKAMNAGKLEEARRLNADLIPLVAAMFIETNPIPVKTALRVMGKPSGPFRLPLCDMSEANLDSLRKTLSSYGLI